MKNKIKSILGNGLPWGLAFFGASFLLGHYAFNVPLDQTLWMGFLIGIAALLANGLIYGRLTKPIKHLENISLQIDSSELLLLAAPASHLIDDSLVAGKLFLTDRRIIFKRYEADEPDEELFSWDVAYSWDLTQVEPTGFFGSLWNKGGEFLLKVNDEASLMFEVNELKPWKKALKKT